MDFHHRKRARKLAQTPKLLLAEAQPFAHPRCSFVIPTKVFQNNYLMKDLYTHFAQFHVAPGNRFQTLHPVRHVLLTLRLQE